MAAGAVALGAGTTACGDGRAAPTAITRVPLADLASGRLQIDHHGEPVELRRSDGAVVARSMICTHQRCTLFWHDGSAAYRCPCHSASFDSRGHPASGPVIEPMWRLPVRVDGDEIVVGGAPAAD